MKICITITECGSAWNAKSSIVDSSVGKELPGKTKQSKTKFLNWRYTRCVTMHNFEALSSHHNQSHNEQKLGWETKPCIKHYIYRT